MYDTKSLKTQTYFSFVDGLKGIACIMIMISHYIGIVKYSQDITYFPAIIWLNKSIFATIIDEGFWLQLFFVISGFLLSYSRVCNIKDLIKRVAKRFLRFYLPILSACFLIYILSKSIGFHNGDTAALFSCPWYQSFYSRNITIVDLIKDPIKTVLVGGSEFNAPYWVIKDMFLSSVLIYFINFVIEKLGEKRVLNIFIYLFVILAGGFLISPIISACLSGALCGVLLKNLKNYIEKIPETINHILCLLCIVFPFGLHNVIYYLVKKCLDIANITVEIMKYLEFRDTSWGVFYFTLLVLLLSGNKGIQKILSCKVLCKFNKISFGIYSFHWPLICSIGALLILVRPSKLGMIMGWIVCIIITFGVSIFYHIVFENNINKIMKKIL